MPKMKTKRAAAKREFCSSSYILPSPLGKEEKRILFCLNDGDSVLTVGIGIVFADFTAEGLAEVGDQSLNIRAVRAGEEFAVEEHIHAVAAVHEGEV